MEEKLVFTKDLVYRAGIKIKEMMNDNVEVSEKTSARDLVTNVDEAIEKMLVGEINTQYEGQSFLTEEKTVDLIETDDLWVIDPIDGTTNFIFQKENFSISVAYYYKQKPVFGIVYDVMKDAMYWGMIGLGGFCNDTKLRDLSQSVLLKESIISGDVYRPDFFKLAPKDLKPLFIANRFLGSGALETALVAAGRFNAYVFPKIKVWDIAAGAIILECVGGTWQFGDRVKDVYFDDVSRVFIASSNVLIMDALVALI